MDEKPVKELRAMLDRALDNDDFKEAQKEALQHLIQDLQTDFKHAYDMLNETERAVDASYRLFIPNPDCVYHLSEAWTSIDMCQDDIKEILSKCRTLEYNIQAFINKLTAEQKEGNHNE